MPYAPTKIEARGIQWMEEMVLTQYLSGGSEEKYEEAQSD
jgi:hypothetical protein